MMKLVSNARNAWRWLSVQGLALPGPVLLTAGSTDWVVGTTSEPVGTEKYKIWSGTAGTIIKNDTSTARVFTVLMIS